MTLIEMRPINLKKVFWLWIGMKHEGVDSSKHQKIVKLLWYDQINEPGLSSIRRASSAFESSDPISTQLKRSERWNFLAFPSGLELKRSLRRMPRVAKVVAPFQINEPLRKTAKIFANQFTLVITKTKSLGSYHRPKFLRADFYAKPFYSKCFNYIYGSCSVLMMTFFNVNRGERL